MKRPFRIMVVCMMYIKFLIGWLLISLDIALILLVFVSSFGLTQI